VGNCNWKKTGLWFSPVQSYVYFQSCRLDLQTLFGDDEDDTPFPQGLKLNLDNDMSDYGEDPETLCGPIIEPGPVPAPAAGPVRISRHTWEKMGPQ